MEWYRRLYLSESLKGRREELISKIEKNAGTRRIKEIYLLTMAANGKDLFDIIKADSLLIPVLHGHCPMIVGIFDDYDDAVDCAVSIITQTYKLQRNFDIYHYLKEQIRDGEDLSYRYPMEKLKRRKFLFPLKNRKNTI